MQSARSRELSRNGDGELADNIKINNERFTYFLFTFLLVGAVMGIALSPWLAIGGATSYAAVKMISYFVEAVLFKRGVIPAAFLFLLHLPFILLITYAAATSGRVAAVWFLIGILMIVPCACAAALLYRRT